VTNPSSNTVAVISTSNFTVVKTIKVGDTPEGIAITPNGKYVYVANLNSNNVSVISTFNNTVIGSVQVGLQPVGLTISPNGPYLYVSNSGTCYDSNPSSVSIVSTLNNTVVGTIKVGACAASSTSAPNGQYIYVANGEAGTISILSAPTTIYTGISPLYIFAFAAILLALILARYYIKGRGNRA
jgi:YVTN family beta-propeller protein